MAMPAQGTATETLVNEKSFKTSLLWFFLKVNLRVTNKRFMGQSQNYLLGLIPTGKNDVTYPISAISSVSSSTSFSLGAFLVGLIMAFTLLTFKPGGIIVGLLGIAILLGAFRTAIAVTNNSGQTVRIPVLIFERQAALELVSSVNNVLAQRG